MKYSKNGLMVTVFCIDENHYHEKPVKMFNIWDDRGENIIGRLCLDGFIFNLNSEYDNRETNPTDDFLASFHLSITEDRNCIT